MTQSLNSSHATRLGRRQVHLPSGNLSAAVFFALVGFAAIDLVDRWHLAQGELAAEVLAHRFILGWIIVGAAAVVWAVLRFRNRELAVVAPDASEPTDGTPAHVAGPAPQHAGRAGGGSPYAVGGPSTSLHASHGHSSHHHGGHANADGASTDVA